MNICKMLFFVGVALPMALLSGCGGQLRSTTCQVDIGSKSYDVDVRGEKSMFVDKLILFVNNKEIANGDITLRTPTVTGRQVRREEFCCPMRNFN